MEIISTILLITLYLIIGIVLSVIYEILTKGMKIVIFNYHLHHSLYSLIFFLIGLALKDITYLLAFSSIAIAIIVQHTITEKKMVFISYEP